MEKDKVAKLKKAALIAVLSTVPAITSSVIAYLEAKSEARSANADVTEKAEAGYQVTRAAYEQMLKDIAELKAEVRLMNQFMLAGLSPTVAGPNTAAVVEMDVPTEEDDSSGEDVVVSETSAKPEKPDRPSTTFKVKKATGDDYAVIKKGNLPEDLNMAQQVLR